MFDNSDTESEPESSLPKCTATDFAQGHNTKERESQESSGNNSTERAIAAVKALEGLDLPAVQRVRLVCNLNVFVG